MGIPNEIAKEVLVEGSPFTTTNADSTTSLEFKFRAGVTVEQSLVDALMNALLNNLPNIVQDLVSRRP